jgi:pimeloyl-ACP methyl ester carboxylesterase
MSRLLELDYSFVNKILLPGTGRKYSGTTSRGLVWLVNSSGNHFPNHFLRKSHSRHVILYCHGNGGTLGDFKAIVQYYFDWFSSSIFSIEYPSYGPAEGEAGEASVNDNLRTAYAFLVNELRYLPSNIVLMGYSIGSGPVIQLASELCEGFGESTASPPLPPVPPAALITISAFMSVKDIIRDRQGGGLVSLLADSIENRWNSIERIKRVTCPTLLLHGLQDSLIPASHSQALFLNSGALEKQLKMCPQADHCRFDEPGDTLQPISDFLSYVHNGLATPNSSYYDASSDGGGSGVSGAERGFPLPVPQAYYKCPASVREREDAASRKKRTAVSGSGAEGGATMACMETTVYDMAGWFGSVGEAIVIGGVNTVVGGFNIAAATASSGARTVAVAAGFSGGQREESERDEEDEERDGFAPARPSSSSSAAASGTEFSRQPSQPHSSSS